MSWLDLLVIIPIVAYCAYIIFGKKKHTCGGNCAGCQGCGCNKKS